ncbi:MAG: translation initiation factor IF-5A [Candidatus Pacearchaeota archaeon]
MVLKLINATEAKPGVSIMIEGEPCTVKSQDISKTGKHGASKCRIEAIGILDEKKRVIVVPGHERFEVPMIKKSKGQVLSVGEKVSIMDLESFETLDVPCNPEIKAELKEEDSVEYWDIEGRKIIKRKA